jgi:hypothetical protein
MQNLATQDRTEPPNPTANDMLADYPVREYVAAMAAELALMARWDGDEALAAALDAVSQQAARQPVSSIPVPRAEESPARPD